MVGAIERELKIKASFNASQAIQQARQLKNELGGLNRIPSAPTATLPPPVRSPLPTSAPVSLANRHY